MGGCCSGGGEESAPLKQRIAQRVDMRTPSTQHFDIQVPSVVTICLDSPDDRSRTIEVSFLNEVDKARFDDALNGPFQSRYLPKNELSVPRWKTAQRIILTGEVQPGHYWLVCRSSSKLSDKCVHIVGTFTSNPIRK